MVTLVSRAGIWLVLLLLSIMASVAAHDTGFAIQAATVAVACLVGLIFAIRSPDYNRVSRGLAAPPGTHRNMTTM
jgi:cytochrome c oxidase cbb3-type subunit 1